MIIPILDTRVVLSKELITKYIRMEEYNKKLLIQTNSLVNYYYFSALFTDDEIVKIKEIAAKLTLIDGNVSGTVIPDYRRSKICWLSYSDETKFIYDKIVNHVKIGNTNMWNFNLSSLNEHIQFSEYNADTLGHYDWHMDFGENASSTRKLSMSIQLTDSDEYEGGDLEFMLHRNIIKAPRKKGTLILFPSYIMHRVIPVTKGTRQSLVFWIHGPPYK